MNFLEVEYKKSKYGNYTLQIVQQLQNYGVIFRSTNNINIRTAAHPQIVRHTGGLSINIFYIRGESIDRDNMELDITVPEIFELNKAIDEFNRHMEKHPLPQAGVAAGPFIIPRWLAGGDA